MNEKLQIIWKEVVLVYWQYYSGICPEELRNTIKSHSSYLVTRSSFEQASVGHLRKEL